MPKAILSNEFSKFDIPFTDKVLGLKILNASCDIGDENVIYFHYNRTVKLAHQSVAIKGRKPFDIFLYIKEYPITFNFEDEELPHDNIFIEELYFKCDCEAPFRIEIEYELF